MKKKLGKLILVLTIIVMQLLAMTTASQAVDYNSIDSIKNAGNKALGKTIGLIGRDSGAGNNINLEGDNHSPYLYCIQKGKALQNKNTYNVAKYIEIEGNVAKIYGNTSDNSKYTTKQADSNAILAYILGGGNYEKGFGKSEPATQRQEALWAYWNTWAQLLGKNADGSVKYSWSGNSGSKNEVYKNAENYAKNLKNSQSVTAQIKSDKTTVSSVGTTDGKELIGPIKLTFTGKLSLENSDGLEFYDSNKNKLNGIQDIKSKQAFYIKNKSNNKISNLKFKVSASNTGIIKARIWIIKNTEKGNPTQRLIIADAGPENTNTNAEVQIKVNHQDEGDLTLIKKDASTKNALKGAEFKVFIGSKDKENSWLGVDKTGAYTYNASYQNATTFTTNEEGKITIKNLKAGTQVRIYETKAPQGYDLKAQEGYDKQYDRVYCNKEVYTVKKSANVTINLVNSITGDLEIIKQDKQTKEALKGAEFKVFIGSEDKENSWLGVDKTGAYIYNASYQNATKFVTDENGKITIKNLKAGTQVRIYETKAPQGYDLKAQEGYDKAYNRVYCNNKVYTVKKSETVTINLVNNRTGDLEIIKQDKQTKEKLKGAQFKISVNAEGNKSKNTWLKQNNDGTYSYTTSYADATAFTTDKDGIIKIERLEPQKYFIYETKAPAGYEIASQENYDSKNEWVYCGSKDVASGSKVEVPLQNAKLISLQGYVWIEKPGSKANEYNDILDNGEDIITDKVTITLRNKSNNEIVAKDPKIVKAKTYNGVEVLCYKFEKIDYNKLKDYYVHFDYSKDYKDYITVASNFDVAEGSKALSDNVPDYDKDLIGMATTYKGSKDEAKYGLSGLATKFYNESTYTLENINLGIKQLPDTPFTISENMAYVDLKIKGYNYRYIYGGTGDKLRAVPTVKFQSKTDKECYTRAIYPADILYENPSDKTQELQAFATYRIDVTNNTKLDVPYLYQEKTLNVTKVTNKYDTNRYELADNNWSTTDKADVVQMKPEYLQKQYYDDYSKGNGIQNEDEKNNKYAYITFKVKSEAIKGVLKVADGTIEDFPTEASVTAYHKYTRIDSSWNNNITKTQTHYTTEKVQNDEAPYMCIIGSEENRTLSGTVFEDKDSKDNGELVGNGIYDETENKVTGVEVKLGNYDGSGKFIPTELYQVDENGNNILNDKNERPIASMKTEQLEVDGKKQIKYSFEGVVPGEYYLQFTYGDGTQKIVDSNGNVVVDNVSSNNYKSTIVTDEIRKAFETDYNPTEATWYIGLDKEYNLAVDDIEQVKNNNNGKYTLTSSTLETRKDANGDAVTAQTPEFSIRIEDTMQTEGNTEQDYISEIKNMDFGIIEIPKTRIDISKKITNIKLTLQNGQVLLEGNPRTQNIVYTTDLDGKTEGGSTYVKVELDSEHIYGGTLEIKYQIAIENNSDIDYIEKEGSATYGNYYKYGEKTKDAQEKTVKIDQVFDYLDPKVSYVSNEGGKVTQINISELKKKNEDSLTDDEKETLKLVKAQEDDKELQFAKILEITDWGNGLNSSKGESKDNSTKAVTINANKILSSQEDDLEFINIAEIAKITTQPITLANVELPQAQATESTTIRTTLGETPEVKLTVTPSTGGDRSILYIAVGTIALVVLAGGIILIKKKVLK